MDETVAPPAQCQFDQARVPGMNAHWKLIDVDARLLFAEVDDLGPTHTRLRRCKNEGSLGRHFVDRSELDFDLGGLI